MCIANDIKIKLSVCKYKKFALTMIIINYLKNLLVRSLMNSQSFLFILDVIQKTLIFKKLYSMCFE